MTSVDAAPSVDPRALASVARRRFDASIEAVERFCEANQTRIAHACERLAERFRMGGRLFVFGSGASASDAQHVSVEFVHPVIVGKRALPAMALAHDAGSPAGSTAGGDSFARQLDVLASSADIALALATDAMDAATAVGLAAARARGLLTIAVVGRGGGEVESDVTFAVECADPMVVQEVQETLYHVLWELVHVFLDRGGAGE